MLDIIVSPDKIVANTDRFRFVYHYHRQDFFLVHFRTFDQEFYIPSGCDSHDEKDLTSELKHLTYNQSEDCLQLRFEYDSNLWKKIYYVDVFSDYISYRYELVGTHRINTLRF